MTLFLLFNLVLLGILAGFLTCLLGRIFLELSQLFLNWLYKPIWLDLNVSTKYPYTVKFINGLGDLEYTFFRKSTSQELLNTLLYNRAASHFRDALFFLVFPFLNYFEIRAWLERLSTTKLGYFLSELTKPIVFPFRLFKYKLFQHSSDFSDKLSSLYHIESEYFDFEEFLPFYVIYHRTVEEHSFLLRYFEFFPRCFQDKERHLRSFPIRPWFRLWWKVLYYTIFQLLNILHGILWGCTLVLLLRYKFIFPRKESYHKPANECRQKRSEYKSSHIPGYLRWDSWGHYTKVRWVHSWFGYLLPSTYHNIFVNYNGTAKPYFCFASSIFSICCMALSIYHGTALVFSRIFSPGVFFFLLLFYLSFLILPRALPYIRSSFIYLVRKAPYTFELVLLPLLLLYMRLELLWVVLIFLAIYFFKLPVLVLAFFAVICFKYWFLFASYFHFWLDVHPRTYPNRDLIVRNSDIGDGDDIDIFPDRYFRSDYDKALFSLNELDRIVCSYLAHRYNNNNPNFSKPITVTYPELSMLSFRIRNKLLAPKPYYIVRFLLDEVPINFEPRVEEESSII